MNSNYNSLILYFLFAILFFNDLNVSAQTKLDRSLEEVEPQLMDYDSLTISKVMVLGTFHFDKSVLNTEKQKSIIQLVEILKKYKPTKIVLEWEPSASELANKNYQEFQENPTFITNKENEVFQLGFRLAKTMRHESLFFFDNQTEFIGSLQDFSFDSFSEYAQKNDPGFFDKYEKKIIETFRHNQNLLKKMSLLDQIVLRNSPRAQQINAQRMHSYEVRVGIQKNWIGPDWLGRWYRRNVRMLANVIKMNKPNDRILVIVGDNHKWTLDMLFENTPEFELVSSWEFFNKELEN
ncbi:DUF5694 domain-containing protein [Flagellimonas sp. 2504JD4-2]